MAYDVARVRGLHPALGDGWIRFDAPAGMVIPESVASTVSTAFRNSSASRTGPHPAARRSTAVLEAARRAVADLVNGDPEGVVLGPDRAALLASLAEAAATRTGLGSEVVVSRLDDEANIVPWLRAADRYGAKLRWAEIDIETGELPTWQWDELLNPDTRLVALSSASATLGTVTDVGAVAKLVHNIGGVVIADHTAAAPYRLLDIGAVDADVVALNATAWGGPPIGALVFRDPGLIGTLTPISTDPHASGAARLELGGHQYGLLAGLVASVEYLASMDEAAEGSRRERLTQSMESAAAYLDGLFDYLVGSLRSMPMVSLIGDPAVRIPVVSFVIEGVPAERVVQRLVDNGVLVASNSASRVLDALGVNEIGGAVTVGLAHYTTTAEVDHLVRALASLG
ncbi:cysteine desulfurase-like protein [Mycolicibacterium sp.]|uniref:cysteine desulfurase-like protein n=1 Tax=Mycolicibacterium sp. TaxID=2320850 RepID=UPI0025F3D091|nr:cysteine desulfurase-like protein [Mycolicibacterium sp.]